MSDTTRPDPLGNARAPGPDTGSSAPLPLNEKDSTTEKKSEIQPTPPTDASSKTEDALVPAPNERHAAGCIRKQALQRRLETMTGILHRLHLLFSSPSSTDRVLCTVTYALKLVSSFLSTLLARRLSSATASLAEKAQAVASPGETLVISGPAKDVLRQVGGVSPKWIALGEWIGRAKNLESLISDYRIFVRLWGFIGLFEWGIGHWKSCLAVPQTSDPIEKAGLTPSSDPVTRKIVWVQIAVNTIYQGLENAAYLGQHKVIPLSPKRQSQAWLWSARCWATHISLDFVRLWRAAALTKARRAFRDDMSRSELKGISDSKTKLSSQEIEKAGAEAAEAWYRSLITNFAYAPLTLHWSLQNGLIGDGLIGVLGTVAGGVGLADSWRRTAS